MAPQPTDPISPSWPDRALATFPAGSNGEYGHPLDHLPVLARGQGCRVWNTEDQEFLDFTMAWGSVLPGHAHPAIVEAAFQAARDGTNFAAVHHRSVELAERIQALSPCAERLRFVASGTEATLLCLRVARTATGRPRILKFTGAYHGQHPIGVAGMLHGQPTPSPAPDPTGAGDPASLNAVLVAPFNNLPETTRIIDAHAASLAAIIVEPLHRCLAPNPDFLSGLRQLCSRHGIALVFDEVVTGFRLAPGGAQQYYGVQPDLVAYGKALGGGFPIGAYAGRADLMEVVNEHRLPRPDYLWSASTTGGNPVSCAAALAFLDLMAEPGIYPRLHQLGQRFRQTLAHTFDQAGVPAQILGDGPIAQFALSSRPVTDQTSWLASDRARARLILLDLLRRGVFLNPMGTKLYLSLAHEEATLDRFAERLAQSLASLPQP
jgi:glutamate-1-semialdehyde 2,1-aminomutase